MLTNKKPYITVYLFDYFLYLITAISLSGILLLTLGVFSGTKALIAGIIMSSTIFLFKVRISFRDKRFGWIFLLIILLALILRFKNSLYVIGGQDQGTYVNISKQYDLNGKLYAVDSYRDSLTRDQQALYDRYGNHIMPSIEKWFREGSEYSMSFYPLHPMFMSVIASMAGSDSRSYSVVLFSIVSVVSFYLLTLEITNGNKKAGYIFALLLAVNPMHVFFGSFTVGETLALALTSSAFYCLARYYNLGKQGSTQVFYLVLSFLLLVCFMFTRMTFFLYFPFLILLSLGSLFLLKDKKLKYSLVVYTFLNLISFIASYLYYRTYLRPLFDTVFYNSIGSPQIVGLVKNNTITIGLITAVFTVVFFFLVKKFHAQQIKAAAVKYLSVFALLAFTVVVLIKFAIFYHVGYVGIDTGSRWHMEGTDSKAQVYSPLYVMWNFPSPFLFLIFPLVVLKQKTRNYLENEKIWYLLFLVVTFLTILIFPQSIRYPYYDTRYYFSEVVPYFLLFSVIVVIFLAETSKYYYVLLILSLCFFGFFSIIQLSGPEHVDLAFYREINSKVSSDDLLLAIVNEDENKVEKYSNNFNSYVMGPLKYYFGYKLFLVNTNDLDNPLIIAEINKYRNVYAISNKKIDDLLPEKDYLAYILPLRLDYYYYNTPPGCHIHNYDFLTLESVKTFPIPKDLACFLPPSSYYHRYREFYLYKVNISK